MIRRRDSTPQPYTHNMQHTTIAQLGLINAISGVLIANVFKWRRVLIHSWVGGIQQPSPFPLPLANAMGSKLPDLLVEGCCGVSDQQKPLSWITGCGLSHQRGWAVLRGEDGSYNSRNILKLQSSRRKIDTAAVVSQRGRNCEDFMKALRKAVEQATVDWSQKPLWERFADDYCAAMKSVTSRRGIIPTGGFPVSPVSLHRRRPAMPCGQPKSTSAVQCMQVINARRAWKQSIA